MKHANLTLQRLVLLGFLGLILLSFPVLNLPTGDWFGLPASYAYLLAIWAVLILCAALVAEQRRA